MMDRTKEQRDRDNERMMMLGYTLLYAVIELCLTAGFMGEYIEHGWNSQMIPGLFLWGFIGFTFAVFMVWKYIPRLFLGFTIDRKWFKRRTNLYATTMPMDELERLRKEAEEAEDYQEAQRINEVMRVKYYILGQRK